MGGEPTLKHEQHAQDAAASPITDEPTTAHAWLARVTRGGFDIEAAGKALRNAPPSLRVAVLQDISTRWGIAAVRGVLRAEGRNAAPRSGDDVRSDVQSNDGTAGAAESLAGLDTGTTSAHAHEVVTPSQGSSSMERARRVAQLGRAHLQVLRAVMLPAYRRAVVATDTAAARALVLQIVGGVAQVIEAQERITLLVPQSDTSPRAASASTADTDPGAPDEAALGALLADKAQLDADVTAAVRELALQVSPQMFGEQPTSGSVEAVGGGHLVERFVYEAQLVVQLLEEADAIQGLAAPTDPTRSVSVQPADGALAQAADRLAAYRSRPINFYFLARVLKQRGVWDLLQGARATDGQTLTAMETKIAKQAEQTGTTADVGSWDAGEASTALGAGLPSWVVTESDAERVYTRLAEVEPRARAGLVKQLHRMALLDRLCAKLPWGMVKQLWESIDDDETSRLLEPYWVGRGGGQSLGQMLSHHWYTRALDKTLNFATFGAKPKIDAAYEARDAGLLSDDAYWHSVTKAVGGAAFVGAAIAATGGIAGEFAAGATEGLGAASSTIVGSAAGGAVGALGGHFAGDVYAQAFEGKQGFDSLGDYARSGAIGGLTGAVTAPLALAAAKYLPAHLRTMAQSAAVARPLWMRVLEAARSSGVGAATRVRMTVQEFTDAMGGGAPPGFRFAYAEAGTAVVPGELAAAGPGETVVLTIRPLQDLNAQTAAAHREGDAPIELEQVSLADQVQEHFDEVGRLGGAPHADVDGSFAGEGSALGEASPEASAVQTRRSARDAGVVPKEGDLITDYHHVFPRERALRSWFEERGIDVDKYCIRLTPPEHGAQHGGGDWQLARQVAKEYPEAEWNAMIMKELNKREHALSKLRRTRKLNEKEAVDVARKVLIERGLSNVDFVRYPRRSK